MLGFCSTLKGRRMGTNCECMLSLSSPSRSMSLRGGGREREEGRDVELEPSSPPRLSFPHFSLKTRLYLSLTHLTSPQLSPLCRSVQAHTHIQILSHALPSPTITSSPPPALTSSPDSSTTAVNITSSTTEGWSLALVPATSQIGLIPQSYFTVRSGVPLFLVLLSPLLSFLISFVAPPNSTLLQLQLQTCSLAPIPSFDNHRKTTRRTETTTTMRNDRLLVPSRKQK